ncbi:hypothetical protein AB733_17435 [Photobacterium swingsii]|uniref:Uncharacterized protein n=1 Tax=Photobacterium swingsii TaxID=680026 RepID=A0A0J8V8C6_9GAMM|nr:hypothetical protein AB733_17435 [Photobacterium swingsii]PSW20936.1 hypothetical protein C9I94_21950 [Photobacterium swingsii]
MDAGSTIVAGLLQVRPKGATQVAPALFGEGAGVIRAQYQDRQRLIDWYYKESSLGCFFCICYLSNCR